MTSEYLDTICREKREKRLFILYIVFFIRFSLMGLIEINI